MIYITGDTHGLLKKFQERPMKKLKADDILLICGDFGFIWEGGEEERKALEWIGSRKYTVAFVDGKHENFDLLNNDYPVEEWCGGKAHHICGSLYHMMRGEVYTIQDKKVLAFGGGESEDKEFRVEAGRWWEAEMPTLQEMENAVSNLDKVERKVDYIISHEPPAKTRAVVDDGHREVANTLEAFFEELLGAVKYEKWFFGSLHQDRKISARHYAVFNDVISADEPEARKRKR